MMNDKHMLQANTQGYQGEGGGGIHRMTEQMCEGQWKFSIWKTE